MASAQTPEPMAADAAGRLAEFARACKAAIRVVSMYPPSHPNIQTALARMVAAGERATSDGPLTMTVRPDTLLVRGQGMPRPDSAVDELAGLLHQHQVGEFTIEAPLTAGGWHLLLSLLATSPEDVRADGGLSRAWQAAGGGPVDIREIDYAEVLKDRSGSTAEELRWEDLIASCLAGDDSSTMDDATLASLLDIARDPDRLSEFISRIQERARANGTSAEVQRQTLKRLLQGLVNHAARQATDEFDAIMDNVATGTTRLSADLMLTLIGDRPTGPAALSTIEDGVNLGGELRARFSEDRLAAFVAENVVRDRGATGRLAAAFNAFTPTDATRRTALTLAEERVSLSPLGSEPEFGDLWEQTVSMLMSYSDADYVPDEYDRELTTARQLAVEIEHISDDPPDRIAAWLSTVGDNDLRALDQQMLVDLLRLEDRPDAWASVLDLALTRLEQLVLVADLRLAGDLLAAVAGVAHDPGSPFAAQAQGALDGMVSGPLVPRLVLTMRHLSDEDMPVLSAFCQALGPPLVRPLIAALSSEESRLVVRRVKDILIGFGESAREPARALRDSANPAVRRVAIEVLRAVGGDDALSDLRSMLTDTDPHVQREALRAIIQVGSDDAYAMLEGALTAGDAGLRDVVLTTLGSFADARAVPLLVYLVRHSSWRGRDEVTYVAMLEAIGRSGTDPRGIEVLSDVLYRGEWWAPRRTARIRSAAARALHATASPAGDAVLADAAQRGPRGVRRAVTEATALPRRSRGPGASQ